MLCITNCQNFARFFICDSAVFPLSLFPAHPAPPTLDSNAVVTSGMVGNGCSRIVDGSAFDVCPALNEVVEFNCLYSTNVPPNVRSLAGDVHLYDSNGNQVSTTMTITSSAQAGTYSCQAQTAVCHSDGTVAHQDLLLHVSVHG